MTQTAPSQQGSRAALTPAQGLVPGIVGGLAGGAVVGLMMQMMEIPMVAMLVGSESVAGGWVVHEHPDRGQRLPLSADQGGWPAAGGPAGALTAGSRCRSPRLGFPAWIWPSTTSTTGTA